VTAVNGLWHRHRNGVLRGSSGRAGGETSVDLGAHDLAVGERMVVSAQQGALEVLPGALQPADLVREGGEAFAGDQFPLCNGLGVEETVDVVERQAGVLQHADEDQPSERIDSVPSLPRDSDGGSQETSALVVAHGGGGNTGADRDLADGKELIHTTHLT
jgi:hypothetical protein